MALRRSKDLAAEAARAQADERAKHAAFEHKRAKWAGKGLKRAARELGLENRSPVSSTASALVLHGDLLIEGRRVPVMLEASAGISNYVQECRNVSVSVSHDGAHLGWLKYTWHANFLMEREDEYQLPRSSASKAAFLTGLRDAILDQLSRPVLPTPPPASPPPTPPVLAPEPEERPQIAELEARPEPVGPRQRLSPLAAPDHEA